MAALLTANTFQAEHQGSFYRWWSGTGLLDYKGSKWTGTSSLILVGPAETEFDGPGQRLQVLFNPELTPNIRQAFLDDLGPIPCEVEWLASRDYGRTWFSSADYKGRMSGQTYNSDNRTMSIDVELEAGDQDRRESQVYSAAVHRATYPNDSCFDDLASNAEGLKIPWPS